MGKKEKRNGTILVEMEKNIYTELLKINTFYDMKTKVYLYEKLNTPSGVMLRKELSFWNIEEMNE